MPAQVAAKTLAAKTRPKSKEGGSIDKHKKLTEAYFANPGKVGLLARKYGMSVMDYLESQISPKDRSTLGASVVEVMMWHRTGADLIGRGYARSSPLTKIGNFTNEEFNKTADSKLFWDFQEDTYCRTLQTGASPEELAVIPVGIPANTEDRLSSLAGLSENTAENPYDEQPMRLSRQWEPQIDYRRIVARVQNTSRQTVRIPYNTTEEGEVEEMDVVPEGVRPLVVELGYSRETLDFTGYGATLEATDDYLLDNQTTAEAIREEVAKLGMRRRETMFFQIIRMIYDACPSGNVTQLGGNELTEESWNLFRKLYENYAMNIMLGTSKAITKWENMYFGVGSAKTVTMDFFARRGTGGSPGVLNNQPSIPDYGWVTREKNKFVDTTTGNGNNGLFLLTFDKRYTVRVWFRRGLAQDEMERVPGERKMRRHLHTDVGHIVPVDGAPSIRRLEFENN